MRDYELVIIIDPTVSEQDAPGVTERVSTWITGHGGEISAINPWGRRRLAYSIREKREGTYVQVLFRSESAITVELERTLNIAEDILRHLLIRAGT